MNTIRTLITVTALSASLGFAACGDDDDEGTGVVDAGTQRDASTTARDATAEDVTDAGTDAGTDAADDASDDAAAVTLGDPQIVAITTAANEGEVAQANAALPKLSNERASAYATMMVEMHTAAQARQSALAAEKGITAEESSLSTTLETESNAIVAQLTAAPADEVDLLYIEAQVTAHTKVLETIENVLIPSADDADLKAELEAARNEVRAHLELAQEVLEDLS